MSRYIDADKLIAELEQQIKNFSIMHNTAASKEDYESMSRIDCVIARLRSILAFVNSLQQEQPEVDLEKDVKWINYEEQKPPFGVEVLAYHHKWVDEDYNPKGIRVGFLLDNIAEDNNTNPFDFTSAYWWNYQDCYMTISKAECCVDDKSKSFYRSHLNRIEPEYWMEMPEFVKPDHLNARKEE